MLKRINPKEVSPQKSFKNFSKEKSTLVVMKIITRLQAERNLRTHNRPMKFR